MAGSKQQQSYAVGDVLYSPFSDRKNVLLVDSGYVLALTYEATGKRRIHLIYGPGTYFPVITTFKHTEQRATYEALTPVKATVVSQADFLHDIDTDQAYCRDILDKTVDQLAIFADRVIDLQFAKLEDKILHHLSVLAKTHGTPSATGTQLPYSLKHHHLADMLGVERESVTRALNRLKKSGCITQTADDQIIINTEQVTTVTDSH